MKSPTRRVGRPKVSVLSRAKVTEAARGIIEARGLESLKMSSLAAALSVTPSALYNHVESRREILDLVADDLLVPALDRIPTSEGWYKTLKAWAVEIHAIMSVNTKFFAALTVDEPAPLPVSVALHERLVILLIEGGWPEDACVPLIVALESFILGSALQTQATDEAYDYKRHIDVAPTFARAIAASLASHSIPSSQQQLLNGFDSIVAWHAAHAGIAVPVDKPSPEE